MISDTFKEIIFQDGLFLHEIPRNILELLVYDQTSKKNIIWANTENLSKGSNFKFNSHLNIKYFDENYSDIIISRHQKNYEDKKNRSRNNAEVYTSEKICYLQNNLIDDEWFKCKNPFDMNLDYELNEKDFEKYVLDTRLEMACGEAPYLVNRYDVVSGNFKKDIRKRNGLLDRKLLFVNKFTKSKEEWMKWTKLSYKNIYGYEFQGDSLLIARYNLLLTFLEFFYDKFKDFPLLEDIVQICEIISWNIWQMDGIKYVIPFSCKETKVIGWDLFGNKITEKGCEGCKNQDIRKHNGKYCKIKDWKKEKVIYFYKMVV